MDYAGRQTALLQRMQREHVDGLLVSHPANIRYLCGFSGSNALLLAADSGLVLYTDGRYREQAHGEARHTRVIVPPTGDLWRTAAAHARRLRRLAIEAEHVSVAQRARLLASSGSARGRGRLVAASGWVEQARAIKDPDEVAAIRRAVALAASVFAPLVRQIRPGMAETALAGRLEYGLRRAGGEGLAFDTIVAAGAHGALVHAAPGAKPIEPQAFVVIDYGVILGGYVSDMTRTVYVGRPDRRARAIYRIVAEAQQAAIAAIRPGRACAAVDRAARRVIERAGQGRYFPHSTGHGLGLEIHESPRLGSRSREQLAAGQVVTVEPGIYIPGWGGVRIEDVVLVTESGGEVLTPTPRTLLTL